MKNLIIALFITLTSFTAKAQEQFNGIWQTEDSSYLKTIIASEYAVLHCFNYSFKEYNVITETIAFDNKNKFTSELYNPDNGYRVTIEYTLINKDSISSKYTGDITGVYGIKRLY
tara:strand:- start:559 stop:903 length:345 start_codon:yes stop_codon:yes gene_type:complete